MIKLTGQMAVPVIVVDGHVVIGFDQARLQELLSGAGRKPPRFGLKITDADNTAVQGGSVSQPGAIIVAVTSGLLGEKVGLKEGDIITVINGQAIGGAADMERVLVSLGPGTIVTFLFKRNGEARKSEIIV